MILIHARVKIDGKLAELYDDIEEFIENRPDAPKARYFKEKIEKGREQVRYFPGKLQRTKYTLQL